MSPYRDVAFELSPRSLRRLARKAQRARQESDVAFERLARRSRVPPRRLRLLADAYGQAGSSGLEAAGPAAGQLPDELLRRIDTLLETWRRRHYPLETMQWRVWRNHLTVWRIVPGANRLGPAERVPVLQLRRTADDRWHLYRKARHGEWWPVVVHSSHPRRGGAPPTIEDCLDTVRIDVACQFWATPRPLDALGHRGNLDRH